MVINIKESGIEGRNRAVAKKKMIQLDARMEQIQTMKDLLHRLQTRCRCDTVEQCGAGILTNGIPNPGKSSRPY